MESPCLLFSQRVTTGVWISFFPPSPTYMSANVYPAEVVFAAGSYLLDADFLRWTCAKLLCIVSHHSNYFNDL